MDSEFIQLSNGKKLTIETSSGRGMAGEQVEFVFLKMGGVAVHLDDVKSFMLEEDYNSIREYLDEVNEANTASAISFAI